MVFVVVAVAAVAVVAAGFVVSVCILVDGPSSPPML